MTTEERLARLERCWEQELVDLEESRRLRRELEARQAASAALRQLAQSEIDAVEAKWRPLLQKQAVYEDEARQACRKHQDAFVKRAVEGWKGGAA